MDSRALIGVPENSGEARTQWVVVPDQILIESLPEFKLYGFPSSDRIFTEFLKILEKRGRVVGRHELRIPKLSSHFYRFLVASFTNRVPVPEF